MGALAGFFRVALCPSHLAGCLALLPSRSAWIGPPRPVVRVALCFAASRSLTRFGDTEAQPHLEVKPGISALCALQRPGWAAPRVADQGLLGPVCPGAVTVVSIVLHFEISAPQRQMASSLPAITS